VPKDIEIAVIDDDEAFQAALVDARFSPGIDPTDTHVQLVSSLDPLSLTATRKSRMQVTQCPGSRPKRLSTTETSPALGITYVFLRQATSVPAWKSAASPREPAHREIYQVITISKPCCACARNATANKWRAATITHARPTGGKNARPFSVSMQQRSQSLRDL